MRKGQAAVEYLAIVSIAVVLAAPFIVRTQSTILDLRSSSNEIEMDDSLDRLQVATRTVHASGEPAARTFRFSVPASVVSAEIRQKRQVRYTLATGSGNTSLRREFEFNLTGNLPESQGPALVKAEAVAGEVNLSVVS